MASLSNFKTRGAIPFFLQLNLQVKNITLIFASTNQNNMREREIKIIPLVFSILGLIACGIAIGYAINDFTQSFSGKAFILAGPALVMFIFILLFSVGVIGEKNKFTW